jgi:hypothetical protein
MVKVYAHMENAPTNAGRYVQISVAILRLAASSAWGRWQQMAGNGVRWCFCLSDLAQGRLQRRRNFRQNPHFFDLSVDE